MLPDGVVMQTPSWWELVFIVYESAVMEHKERISTATVQTYIILSSIL